MPTTLTSYKCNYCGYTAESIKLVQECESKHTVLGLLPRMQDTKLNVCCHYNHGKEYPYEIHIVDDATGKILATYIDESEIEE